MNDQTTRDQARPDRDEEAKRLAADRAYNRMKNDGTLRRQEDARALAIQIKEGAQS